MMLIANLINYGTYRDLLVLANCWKDDSYRPYWKR